MIEKMFKPEDGSVVPEIATTDDAYHVHLVMRDRAGFADTNPAKIEIFSVSQISEFIQGAPHEVHYLVFGKGKAKQMLKISFMPRLKSFNLHFGTQTTFVESLDKNSISLFADKTKQDSLKELSSSLDD